MAILDEIDSGLDVDALRDVATAVNGLRKPNKAILLITHYQRLLDYINPDYVHIMVRRAELVNLLLSLHEIWHPHFVTAQYFTTEHVLLDYINPGYVHIMGWRAEVVCFS